MQASLKAGADIIVNTDADNQYCADDIPKLIAPIMAGNAEIVVGARPIADTAHFSPVKKLLQRLGSWVVRLASHTDIPDAPSGFRAISRDAAMRLHVFGDYTYTLETIIQAGQKDIAITSVPIRTNQDLRPSRMVRNVPTYIRQSILTIVRIYMTYRPFEFFAIPGLLFLTVGVLLGLRFLVFYFTSGGQGHIQSLILASTLLADLISVNRKLLETIEWRIQQLEDIARDRGLTSGARAPSAPGHPLRPQGAQRAGAGTTEAVGKQGDHQAGAA